MKILTINEQRYVLEQIPKLESLNYGSSRIVFKVNDEIIEKLGLDDNNDYVIKLAVGLGGFNQTAHEVEFFLQYGDAYLARIVGYGQFFIIMERVDPVDLSDYADIDGEEDVGYLAQEIEDLFDCDYYSLNSHLAAETIIFLTNVCGSTSDNGQIGIANDGRVVAYDYGFIPDEGCHTQCSSEMSDILYQEEEAIKNYIGELCGFLEIIEKLQLNSMEIYNHMIDIENRYTNC